MEKQDVKLIVQYLKNVRDEYQYILEENDRLKASGYITDHSDHAISTYRQDVSELNILIKKLLSHKC